MLGKEIHLAMLVMKPPWLNESMGILADYFPNQFLAVSRILHYTGGHICGDEMQCKDKINEERPINLNILIYSTVLAQTSVFHLMN